jgi:uncharacterized protein YraI
MKHLSFMIVFLFISVILSACGPSTPTPMDNLSITASPRAELATSTTKPTSTTAAALADTVTPAITATQTTTPVVTAMTTTPTFQGTVQVVPTLNAYCRKGPGTLYSIVTFLQKGNAYDVVGRNSQSTWWLVKTTGVDPCWVGGSNVSINGPMEQIKVIQEPPLPEKPSLFVNSYVCNTTLNTLGVSLDWAAAQGATGYRIYQNGTLLTTVAGSVTSYHDDAPTNLDLMYELEAYNEFGVSVRVQTSVPACK